MLSIYLMAAEADDAFYIKQSMPTALVPPSRAGRCIDTCNWYQIRSYYISSSHTRLIRCLTLTGLSQARTDESGNTNFVILPHKCLHCSWALK